MKPVLWTQRTLNSEEINNLAAAAPLLGGIVSPLMLGGDPGGYLGYTGDVKPAIEPLISIADLCKRLSIDRYPCKLYKQLWCFSNNPELPALNSYIHLLLDKHIEPTRIALQDVDNHIGNRCRHNYLLDTEIYKTDSFGNADKLGWSDAESSRTLKASKIFSYRPDIYCYFAQLYPRPKQLAERQPLPGWYKFHLNLKTLPPRDTYKPECLSLDYSGVMKAGNIGISKYANDLGYVVLGARWREWEKDRNPEKLLLNQCNIAYASKITPYIYDATNFFATREGARILAKVCGKVKK